MNNLIERHDIKTMVELAFLASREIMLVYASQITTRDKADLSPVTDADERAERVILRGLKHHWPEIPVVAEESAAAGKIPAVGNVFFLVDPLDGTKEFITRNGEFTVNIARIENGKPIAGIVMAPAIGKIWCGAAKFGAAKATYDVNDPAPALSWTKCCVRSVPETGLTVVASRSHRDQQTENYLKSISVASIKSTGSSLKFCLLAEGEADLYPRFGRTMEWDTAAGHAVLAAAGGYVRTVDGAELNYGKLERGFDNPAFIACTR